ncbi:BCE_3a_G0015570.mRNA.1.CDS.1 [Saccharomyces cerevisiae]|nr:BCE_3a_G0015570.mRNA.1.CDS.1 [Saccharomyces cerevisiae]CAI7102039.1 BCE_3a_G0015570.mRNA.1.CDS.1 [Saccharomyces cerevisiae]
MEELICTYPYHSNLFMFLFLFFCPSKRARRGHPKFLFTLCYKSNHLIPKLLPPSLFTKRVMLNPSSHPPSLDFPTGSSASPRVKLRPSTLWAPPLTVSSAFAASSSSTAPVTVTDKPVTPAVSKRYQP